MKVKPIGNPSSPGYYKKYQRGWSHKKNKKTMNKISQMKQMSLPFTDPVSSELKVFELYKWRDPKARYKSYGAHVDYIVANNLNEAEDLFSNTYPDWWRYGGVLEVDAHEVKRTLELLEQQVETCKTVLLAVSIESD